MIEALQRDLALGYGALSGLMVCKTHISLRLWLEFIMDAISAEWGRLFGL